MISVFLPRSIQPVYQRLDCCNQNMELFQSMLTEVYFIHQRLASLALILLNIKIYLYTDGDCNGIATAPELTDSVTVDSSGFYQFVKYPEKTVADDFDGTGGTSTCASGTDGDSPWASNWTDAGDPSTGFCNNSQSVANTDVEIVKDGAFGFALRL